MNPSLGDIPLSDLHSLIQPIKVDPTSNRARFSNWAQTFHCQPRAVFEPENEYQCELILELARREGRVVRAAGVGHSPSDLACTTEFMVRTERLNRVLEVVCPCMAVLCSHFDRSMQKNATSLLKVESHCTIFMPNSQRMISP